MHNMLTGDTHAQHASKRYACTCQMLEHVIHEGHGLVLGYHFRPCFVRDYLSTVDAVNEL